MPRKRLLSRICRRRWRISGYSVRLVRRRKRERRIGQGLQILVGISKLTMTSSLMILKTLRIIIDFIKYKI